MQPTTQVQYEHNIPHQLELHSLSTMLLNSTAEKNPKHNTFSIPMLIFYLEREKNLSKN